MTHDEALNHIGKLEAEKHRLLMFVERLAQMPDTNEDMLSTMCPPDWDDLCDWWREFVREARKITGKSYRA